MKQIIVHLNELYKVDTDSTLEILIPDDSDCKGNELGISREVEADMMLVIPGGGYQFCSNREADAVALAYMTEGFASAILRYSLERIFPAPHKDVMAAIDYLRTHAKELRIRPDRISIVGFSAGGHLAGSYGYVYHDENVVKEMGLEGHDLAPNIIVLGYPVITTTLPTHGGTRDRITGGDPKLLEYMSIEKHITKDYPPTFIWTTLADTIVPPISTKLMDKALTEADVRHVTIIYDKIEHGSSTCQVWVNRSKCEKEYRYLKLNSSWVEASIEFIKGVYKEEY